MIFAAINKFWPTIFSEHTFVRAVLLQMSQAFFGLLIYIYVQILLQYLTSQFLLKSIRNDASHLQHLLILQTSPNALESYRRTVIELRIIISLQSCIFLIQGCP